MGETGNDPYGSSRKILTVISGETQNVSISCMTDYVTHDMATRFIATP